VLEVVGSNPATPTRFLLYNRKMLLLLLTLVTVFVLLVINELWWRARRVHGEFSRKFIHITVGSFVAAWPFFLSWREIELLSVAFVVVVSLSKYLNIFKAIHSAQRPTWGELFFALAVGLIAVVTHDKWVYAAALLQMGLADGLAAIIGVHYGNRLKYLIFQHPKSAAGTLTFFVTSLGILLAFNQWGDQSLSVVFMLLVTGLATILENLAVFGLDNLLVPLFVALMLANH
jgi:phytol kinase